MQRPIRVEPYRWHSKGQATRNHVEIYLPSQVAVFFVDDEAAMIVHISSGDGQEWKEVVTIDPGEFGNENGTEPIVRREIGVSVTPGGVFRFERMVDGLRNSALGGMWDPAYFNYGIAMHGALNVPLHPASHGCIRMSQTAGRTFHQYIDIGDQVFVWDGIKEPEYYAQNPGAAYPRASCRSSTASTRRTRPRPRRRHRRPQRWLRPCAPTQRRRPRRRRRRSPRRPLPTQPATTTTAAAVTPIRRRPRRRPLQRRRLAHRLSRRRPRHRGRGRARATPSFAGGEHLEADVGPVRGERAG